MDVTFKIKYAAVDPNSLTRVLQELGWGAYNPKHRDDIEDDVWIFEIATDIRAKRTFMDYVDELYTVIDRLGLFDEVSFKVIGERGETLAQKA